MKNIVTGLVLAVMAASSGAQASHAQTAYIAGERIVGSEFFSRGEPAVARWLELWVASHKDGRAAVSLVFETSLGDGSLSLGIWEVEGQRLRAALGKALEWSVVARANEAETNKLLGCFGLEYERERCEKWGAPLMGQLAVRFFAGSGGRESGVSLSMKGLAEEHKKALVMLDIVQVRKLIAALDDVEATRVRAAAMDAKADVFQ